VADRSSWVRFLPPVLWEKEPPPPAFSLGATLRIFEKMLTGIDDAEVLVHGDHQHESFVAVIERLHRLYRPWQTPPEFLDWLGSWVALRFPPIWDEYQRRKLTSEMVQVYLQRGLKRGIERYLDLYTVAEKRPRVTVDDSAKLLVMRPEPSRFAEVTSLVAQVPMVMPMALARAPDGSLFVADIGAKGNNDEALWRVFPGGQYQFGGAPPLPDPIGPPAFNLQIPVAVAVDGQAPWRVYVLDRPAPIPNGNTPMLYRLTSPGFPAADVVATRNQLAPSTPHPQPIYPVAMAFDLNGHLLVLDRGPPPQSALPASPRILDLDVSVSPPTVVATALAEVIEPLSLTVLASGALVIGDGRDQGSADPADLVLVDRASGPPWIETLLLAALAPADNPLATPTAVVEEAPGRLLVLDVGLKPFLNDVADPFMKQIARQAAVYRVDLAPTPVVSLAVEPKQLVWPTGMVLDPDGNLYVSDRGEYADTLLSGPVDRNWRAGHQEFGVVVYFPETPATTQQERRRIVHDIRQIVTVEKPAHAGWSFLYRV
jgi:phage tail-like protein